jgi:two-component system chemotaxis sensor kinase CheA
VDDFDDVIKEFIVESYESLDQLDRDLVALEDAPKDGDRLGSIFRAVHSMKVSSGFLVPPQAGMRRARRSEPDGSFA